MISGMLCANECLARIYNEAPCCAPKFTQVVHTYRSDQRAHAAIRRRGRKAGSRPANADIVTVIGKFRSFTETGPHPKRL